MPWKKGQSGNPKGRPPVLPEELLKLLDAYSPEAIETLHSIMLDKKQPGACRIAAAVAILKKTVPDRVHKETDVKGTITIEVPWKIRSLNSTSLDGNSYLSTSEPIDGRSSSVIEGQAKRLPPPQS